MNKISIIMLVSIILVFNSILCIAASCTIQAFPLNFGTYVAGVSSSFRANASIIVSCSPSNGKVEEVPYKIKVTTGDSRNSNVRFMRLINAESILYYNLFTDPARTTVLGDGASGTGVVAGICKTGEDHTSYIYGTIPAGQSNVKAGQYTDNLMLTIEY